jgi:hypothetical protein
MVAPTRSWTASLRASSGDAATAASTCARRSGDSSPSASAAMSPSLTPAMQINTRSPGRSDCSPVVTFPIDIERRFRVTETPDSLEHWSSTAIELTLTDGLLLNDSNGLDTIARHPEIRAHTQSRIRSRAYLLASGGPMPPNCSPVA